MRMSLLILVILLVPVAFASQTIDANVKNRVQGPAKFDVLWVASDGSLENIIPCAGGDRVSFENQGEIKLISCTLDDPSAFMQESKVYKIKLCLVREGEKSCEALSNSFTYTGCSVAGDIDSCLAKGKCVFVGSGVLGRSCKSCSEMGFSRCEDYSGKYINQCEKGTCAGIECKRDGDKCVKRIKPKLTLVFAPINWKGTEQEYEDKVDYYMEKVYTEFPLSACKERINNIVVPLKYNIEFDFASSGKNFNERSSSTFDILSKSLADLGYKDKYDFAIGIYGESMPGTGGFTGKGRNEIILVYDEEYTIEGKFTLVHELGHKFGLNDEYFDAVRCDFLVIDPNANKLEKDLGGDIPLMNKFQGFCAEGYKCLKYDENGNLQYCEKDSSGGYSTCQSGGQTSTCKGNHLDEEMKQRCIMSYSEPDENAGFSWYTPKVGFCQECQDFLKTVPQLNCDTED